MVYPGYCGTPTVDLLTSKLLLNSVISTPAAKFMTIDIKDFYLNTPMDRFEYMKLKLSDLPEDFVTLYKLVSKVDKNGFVYLEIIRGMYGLPQAGIPSQQLLEKQLNNTIQYFFDVGFSVEFSLLGALHYLPVLHKLSHFFV